MNGNGTITETGGGSNSSRNTSLLRIGVLFLALVSFFTTANGMQKYIFKNNGAVAYAASAAVQSILLALSMNLPKYLQGIWNSGKESMGSHSEGWRASRTENNSPKNRWAGKTAKWLAHYLMRFILCVITIALTIVTILCSSWFSYVYIADVIHKDSWDTDSQLLVQQTYRMELYNARDYAHAYRTYLEECVGEDILELEGLAQTIADSESNVEVDWEDESANYLSDNGTAASYMSPVILAMETAMEDDPSQESRDLAAIAIGNAKENIENRIEAVQANLDRINTNLANYNQQISNLTSRINAATEETDVTSLNTSINNLTRLINDNTQEQIRLQQESTQLDSALLRLPFYESILGLSNSTSSISIRAQLIEMQSEFFKANPDDQILLDTATDIFDNLRNAATTAASGGTGQAQNILSYTNLLAQMNRLLRNLADYSEVKAIEANLDEMIAALRTTSENEPDDIKPAPDGTTPEENDAEPNPDGAPPEQDELQANTDEPLTNQGETENPDTEGMKEQEPSDQKADSEKKVDGTWQEVWHARLEDLAAQISAMPVYNDIGEAGAADTENSGNSGNIHVLTDSQLEVLRGYDRNASNAALDDMIRRYVSDHNAIYQGIIYLMSPYRMLAIFALCLALSFDLSGFVFGVVLQGEPPQKENRGGQKDTLEDTISHRIGAIPGRAKRGNSQAEWSILDHLHSYRVLTGDFSHKGGTYYYHVFRDGLAEQWPVKDADGMAPYKQGIYVLEEDEGKTGTLVADAGQEAYTHQELLYSGQTGGPQDGVFLNCCLAYKEGGLSRQESDGTWSFICSLEEYVPVHCYDPAEKESRTFPVKLLAQKRELAAKTAVVALNKSGTRASAIYVIKDS